MRNRTRFIDSLQDDDKNYHPARLIFTENSIHGLPKKPLLEIARPYFLCAFS